MKILNLLLPIFTYLLSSQSLDQPCNFDGMYNTNKSPTEKQLNSQSYPLQNPETQNPDTDGRVLQTSNRNNIRITLDSNTFSEISPGQNGASSTTISNLNFIERAMQVTKTYFGLRLKVFNIPRVRSPNSSCVDYMPVANDINFGIADSDLHVYVLYITDRNTAYRATGKSCNYRSGSLPDLTELSVGRPDLGRIKFNTYQMVDGQVLTNRLFASVTATAMHQLIHILGFDASLYSTFLDPSTGNVYGAGFVTQNVTTSIHATRTGVSGDTYAIITPFVKQWVQDFFSCPLAIGMLLENQDSAEIGSHWERLAVYDQMMTATDLGPQKGISGVTLSLLKDMGWYEVQGSWNDTDNYGYHQGCDFLNSGCYGTFTSNPSFSKYFCTPASLTDISLCSTNFLSKAICISAGTLSDGCGIYGGYTHCVDPDISDDGYGSYTLERFSTDSFCLASTLSTVTLSEKLRSRCYSYTCHEGNSTIDIHVSTVTISCSVDGEVKVLSGMTGTLTCPIFDDFCANSRKLCPNWCSKNGFCTRGNCNCLPGFSGSDCSKTNCASGQFFDPLTGVCLTTCTTKYYQNIFSHTCEKCGTACPGQCRDEPQICTNCISTILNPEYFYQPNSTCLSACPSETYRLIDQCKDCTEISPNFCASCENSPTNCTSCVLPYYLSSPTYGTCGTVCTAPNVLKDVVNNKCVPNCVDNLVQITGTCDKCAAGGFKLISDSSCNLICPARFFSNTVSQLCQNCDQSCLNCDGTYSENCTECSSVATEKYLLLKMCVSTCPKGYYASDADGQCYECPSAENCESCALDGATSKCTSCKYSFYHQLDKTCLPACDQYFYKNTWNHTCDPCDLSCGDCTTPDPASCTNCRGLKKFLTNFTGGFCLQNCPSQNYVTSGNNCLECHTTCKTCNGVSSQNCLGCIDGLFRHSGICRYACPSGTYHQASDLTCPSCHSNCTYCFGEAVENCTACLPGLFLNNFTCVGACPFQLRENQWNVCFGRKTEWILGILLITMIVIVL